MSFGSNVTPKRFGAGAIRDKLVEARQERKEFEPVWEANLRAASLPIEYLKGKEGFDIADAEPDPEPVPDLPIVWNDITLNDCYRCGHRGNNPVPGCGCCANEHNGEPADPED